MSNIIVTGGAGFIGSALIRHFIIFAGNFITNIDKLTYAGNCESCTLLDDTYQYHLEHIDICNNIFIPKILSFNQPDIILHLAAETHVDRSIDGPADFIQTNIVGTYTLLECAREYWNTLEGDKKANFRFIHVSTDEVFGDLGDSGGFFSETTPYAPSSPYSASKASSDHLVRAWHRTYGLPTIVTNCSNNYGPYQFPEKLIPLTILNALEGKPLPVYGKGEQIRDWLYVEDHVKALCTVLEKGKVGETYTIGGNNEQRNIDVVREICRLLDEIRPRDDGHSYSEQITFVSDRPGHDMRYAIDASKIKNELGWEPKETFSSGLRKTIEWYLANAEWCQHIQDGSYRRERLGLGNHSSSLTDGHS